jgi:hypothetical protein
MTPKPDNLPADMTKLSPQALKAAMTTGTDGWGQIGNSAVHARYVAPHKSRRKCHCGCGQRASHLGMCNGVGMTTGCELWCRRWAKK